MAAGKCLRDPCLFQPRLSCRAPGRRLAQLFGLRAARIDLAFADVLFGLKQCDRLGALRIGRADERGFQFQPGDMVVLTGERLTRLLEALIGGLLPVEDNRRLGAGAITFADAVRLVAVELEFAARDLLARFQFRLRAHQAFLQLLPVGAGCDAEPVSERLSVEPLGPVRLSSEELVQCFTLLLEADVLGRLAKHFCECFGRIQRAVLDVQKRANRPDGLALKVRHALVRQFRQPLIEMGHVGGSDLGGIAKRCDILQRFLIGRGDLAIVRAQAIGMQRMGFLEEERIAEQLVPLLL